MKKMRYVYRSYHQKGFTIMELVVAMAMMAAIMTTLAPVMMNPSRNLDRAIKKSSVRQTLNQQLVNLGNYLEKSYPMRNEILDCQTSTGNEALGQGFATIGAYGDNLSSEDEGDYSVYEITEQNQSIKFYYTSYDGVAAFTNTSDSGLYVFSVVSPREFKEGDLVALSTLQDVTKYAFVIVEAVNNDASTISVKGISSFSSEIGCNVNTDNQKTLQEVITSIDYFQGNKKSYKPHTFRARNLKLIRYNIEAGDNFNDLVIYRYPISGELKKEIMIPGIQKFSIWERWLPDGNDANSSAGVFVGRTYAEYTRVGASGTQANSTGAEKFKLNATYTISKGLRTNYEVITSIKNETFDAPEGSLTYSLLDDGKECNFGPNYPNVGWRMQECFRPKVFYQYIHFKVKTNADSPSIVLNLPAGFKCWDADNVTINDGTNRNYGLVFNSRRSISSTAVTLYNRGGYNLYCRVNANTTASLVSYNVSGTITNFVEEYNKTVTKQLNNVQIDLPPIQEGFREGEEPRCGYDTFSIETGILNSLKPTYIDGDYEEYPLTSPLGGLNPAKPQSCLWNDGTHDVITYCTLKQAYRKDLVGSSAVLDEAKNLYSINPDLTQWHLVAVKIFPSNLADIDLTDDQDTCVYCENNILQPCGF